MIDIAERPSLPFIVAKSPIVRQGLDGCGARVASNRPAPSIGGKALHLSPGLLEELQLLARRERQVRHPIEIGNRGRCRRQAQRPMCRRCMQRAIDEIAQCGQLICIVIVCVAHGASVAAGGSCGATWRAAILMSRLSAWRAGSFRRSETAGGVGVAVGLEAIMCVRLSAHKISVCARVELIWLKSLTFIELRKDGRPSRRKIISSQSRGQLER